MKKILILLLITSAAYSQNTTNPIKQVRPFTFQYRPDSITPVWSSAFQNGDHALCLQDSSMWVYNKSALKWRKAQTVGGTGKDGISPTVNVKSVTTATGVAGINAVVGVTDSDPSANVDLNFSFIIPRGADGSNGGAGGNVVAGYYSPDMYGAIKTSKTLGEAGYTQSKIDATFPNIGATPNDQVDWAAYQYCISVTPDGGTINAGGYYYLNRGLKFADNKRVYVYGGVLNATNNNVWTFLYRTAPGTNEVLANLQNANRFSFNNMTIYGMGNQVGHEMQGSYNSTIENIQYNLLTDCGIMNFELNTKVSYCMANGCARGWSVGYLPGLTKSFYQSNNVHFYACQFRGNPSPNPSEYAFKFRGVSGCKVDRCIIEGKQVINGVDFDDENLSTIFEFLIAYTHFECEQGAVNAAFKIRSRQGIIILDTAFGQSQALLADCYSYTGNSRLLVKNVPYWVPNASGKMFRNQDFSYVFENCYGTMYKAADIPALFTGTPVVQLTGTSVGNNAFKHIGLP